MNSIEIEDSKREVVDAAYATFKSRREQSQMQASTSVLFDPSLINFDSPLHTPTSLSQAVDLGRSLISGETESSTKVAKKPTSRKGKGKQVASTVEEGEPVQAQSSDVRLQVRPVYTPHPLWSFSPVRR